MTRRRKNANAGVVVLDLGRRRVLVDADAGGERCLRQAGDELPRVDESRVGLVPEAREVGRGVDLRANRVGVEELVLVAVLLEQHRALLEPPDFVRFQRDGEVAGELEVAADPEALDVAPRTPGSSRWPSRSSCGISSAKRARPFSIPCVSDPSAKPPFRPLAPMPTVSASRTTTSRPGSSAFAWRAAQSPVNPPPTMQRSASLDPSSGGSGSRGGSASSQ